MVKYIKSLRDKSYNVHHLVLRKKAIEFGKEFYPDQAFKASAGWLYKFMARNQLVNRRVTSVGQKMPDNARELAIDYFEVLDSMKGKKEHVVVANMDETPCWFDIPSTTTVDFKGIFHVSSTCMQL